MSSLTMTAVRKRVAALFRKLADKMAPDMSLEGQIRRLMRDPTFEAILKAVRKQETDPGMRSADVDVKRAEALEWALHYATKKYARSDAWLTRFLLELAVGVVKGKLHQ